MAEWYSIVYVCHIFFIHSSVDGHLGCFHVLGFPSGSVVKKPPVMQETRFWSLGWEDSLEEGIATHSSTLSWRISGTEEPEGLQSMGLQRVGHEWRDLARTYCTLVQQFPSIIVLLLDVISYVSRRQHPFLTLGLCTILFPLPETLFSQP